MRRWLKLQVVGSSSVAAAVSRAAPLTAAVYVTQGAKMADIERALGAATRPSAVTSSAWASRSDRGQFCARRADRQYHRYGFDCHRYDRRVERYRLT